MLTSCQKIVTPFSFFEFLTNLDQSGGQIPDTESAKVMFSVIGTVFLTKAENSFLDKNANCLKKKWWHQQN